MVVIDRKWLWSAVHMHLPQLLRSVQQVPWQLLPPSGAFVSMAVNVHHHMKGSKAPCLQSYECIKLMVARSSSSSNDGWTMDEY